jgi:homoaconitase/3-isopropylmalate dehydratase large subunit
VQPDDVTFRWLEGRVPRERWDVQTTDSDRDYVQIIDIDLNEIDPSSPFPHNLSAIKPAGALSGVSIDEAILGPAREGGSRISGSRRSSCGARSSLRTPA